MGQTLSDVNRAASQDNFDKAITYYNNGNNLLNSGKLEEALASYNQAIEVNPKFIEALNNKGTVLAKMGKVDESLETFEQGLKINPDISGLWLGKGLALSMKGNFKEGLQAIDQSLKINPSNNDAINARSRIISAMNS
jgi:tetratricopeptide (TPR) repeat protein